MTDFSLLGKLTIVIFSYNRHKYLVRTINYWSNYNVKLLVLDGSSTKLNDLCLQKKNIKYVYNTSGLYRRFLSSVNYIDTEFTILSSDDEFYLPSALSSCIEFLSKEIEFSNCGGRAIGFRTDKKNIFGMKAYPRLNDFCLGHNNAIDRVTKHFSNYVPAHFYSVMRTRKWKIICKFVFEKQYNLDAAFELQVEFLCVVAGKSKIIPELMWMRNKEVLPINFDLTKLKKKKWWLDKKYQNEKLDFLKRMKKACDELLKHQETKINEDTISKVFQIYINSLSDKKTFIGKIKKLMPYRIKRIIRSILSVKNRFIISKNISLRDEITLLEEQNVSVNHKCLNQVISILQHSNNENL